MKNSSLSKIRRYDKKKTIEIRNSQSSKIRRRYNRKYNEEKFSDEQNKVWESGKSREKGVGSVRRLEG